MCFTVPGKLISVVKKDGEDVFIVDYGSEKREAIKTAVDVNVGDYVIMSNKIIITKLEKEEAEQFYDLL
jgi:hydrogenase maturation factor